MLIYHKCSKAQGFEKAAHTAWSGLCGERLMVPLRSPRVLGNRIWIALLQCQDAMLGTTVCLMAAGTVMFLPLVTGYVSLEYERPCQIRRILMTQHDAVAHTGIQYVF